MFQDFIPIYGKKNRTVIDAFEMSEKNLGRLIPIFHHSQRSRRERRLTTPKIPNVLADVENYTALTHLLAVSLKLVILDVVQVLEVHLQYKCA